MQWRSRGYQGHQVVALAHSDQGCALVGLCLSMCEVGVRAGGVCESCNVHVRARVWGVMSRCKLKDPR